MRVRREGIPLAFAVIQGCAGASSHAPAIAPAHMVRASSAPPAPTVQARWIVRGARAAPMRVSTPDTPTHEGSWVVGGFRFAGDAVRADDVPLATAIDAAIPLHHGWWFAAGTAGYRADTFTGALRLASASTRGRIGHGPGREVHLLAGSLVGAPPPGRSRVLDAAFSDETHGVAVTEPGDAWATSDGGAHWTAVPLAHDAAERVIASDTARWIVGHETAMALADDGTREERPREAAPGWMEPESDESRVADLQRRVEADTVEVLALAVQQGVRDGTRVFATRGNRIGVYDLATDRWTVDDGPLLPCSPETLLRGATLSAVCVDGEAQRMFGRTRDGGWTTQVASLGAPNGACFVSDDGTTMACDGMCAGDDVQDPRNALCVRARDGTPRTVSLPAGQTGLVGDAPWRLVELVPGAVRFAGPDREIIERPITPRSNWVAAFELTLDADRRVRITVADPNGRRGLLEGRVDGAIFAHAMPDDVDALWLAGDTHLWRRHRDGSLEASDDGATSWRPLAEVRAADACSHTGCVASDRVLLGWGEPAPSTLSAREAAQVPDASARARPPSTWECASHGAMLHIPRLDPPVGLGAFVTASEDARGSFVVRERPLPRAEAGAEVTASWLDRTHATPGHAPPSATFRIERLADRDATWTAVRLAPTRAEFVRCGSGPAHLAPRCDLLVVRPPDHGSIVAALPTPPVGTVHDGPLLALLSPARDTRPATLATLGADGIANVRTVTLADDGVGLYALEGTAGVLRARDDGALLLEPDTTVTAPASTDLCPASARGDLAVPAVVDLLVDALPLHTVRAFAHYGLDGERRCLRALDAEVEQVGPPGWLLAAPGPDGITGSAGTHFGTAPITCRPTAAPPPHPNAAVSSAPETS